MSILGKIFNIFNKESKVPLMGVSERSVFASLASAFGGDSNSKYYKGWIYACVRAIAEKVATIDLRLNKEDSQGNKERVFEHPALTAIDTVNPYFTKFTLFERLQSNLEMEGHEYWLTAKNAATGQPAEIYPLEPWRVKPIPDPLNFIKGYTYTLDGETWELPIEDIVPFRNFNPESDIKGFSTLQAVKIAAETDEFAKRYNRNFFVNSAKPDMVLKYKQALTKDQKSELYAKIKDAFTGFQKNGKTMVLDNNAEIDTLKVSHQDMEFIEQRRFTRDEMLGIFRVPKIVAGIMEDVNYATAEAALYAFMTFTIIPKMQRIADSLNEFYLPLFEGTEGMSFEVANQPPEDRSSLIMSITDGISGGVLSINDGRRLLGLPEIENGESVFAPFGAVPYGQPEQKQLPPEKPVSKTAADMASSIIKALEVPKKKCDCNCKDWSKDHMKDCKNHKKPKKKDAEEFPRKEGEEFEAKGLERHKQAEDRLEKWDKKFTKLAQQIFDRQKKEALKNLDKVADDLKGIQKRTDIRKKAKQILDMPKEIKVTAEIYEPEYFELMKESGDEAMAYLGVDDAFDPSSKFVKDNVESMATSMTNTTITSLTRSLEVGIEQGESIQELKRRITRSAMFQPQRAEMIARTETARASSQADVQAWSDSGVVTKKIWYTALDERVCPYCEFMHGKTVSIDKTFMNDQGLVELGVTPYQPLDSPPLHPSCRCVMIPEIE